MTAGRHLDAALRRSRRRTEALLAGRPAAAAYRRARDAYWRHMPSRPAELGTAVGGLKMAILAGDGVDADRPRALAETDGVDGRPRPRTRGRCAWRWANRRT